MSEPAWNTKEKREKLMELVFEKFNAPGKVSIFIVMHPFKRSVTVVCSDKDSYKPFMWLSRQYLLHLQMVALLG